MAEPEKSLMTCEELLRTLNDYVDDETIIAVCQEFAAHLAGIIAGSGGKPTKSI